MPKNENSSSQPQNIILDSLDLDPLETSAVVLLEKLTAYQNIGFAFEFAVEQATLGTWLTGVVPAVLNVEEEIARLGLSPTQSILGVRGSKERHIAVMSLREWLMRARGSDLRHWGEILDTGIWKSLDVGTKRLPDLEKELNKLKAITPLFAAVRGGRFYGCYINLDRQARLACCEYFDSLSGKIPSNIFIAQDLFDKCELRSREMARSFSEFGISLSEYEPRLKAFCNAAYAAINYEFVEKGNANERFSRFREFLRQIETCRDTSADLLRLVGHYSPIPETIGVDSMPPTWSVLIERVREPLLGSGFDTLPSSEKKSIENPRVIPGGRVVGGPGGPEALSQLQYDILDGLRNLKAFDHEKRATGTTIAKGVGGDATDQSVKAPLADLKKKGLVDSKTGKGGGSWLSQKGRDYINSLRPKK